MSNLKTRRNKHEAHSGTARPRLSIVPYNARVYTARATEYGADKYARDNYLGPIPKGADPVDVFLEYLDAVERHIGKTMRAIAQARANGGDVRAACGDQDTEHSVAFPPSLLPHVAHALAGLHIAVEIGIKEGLLPDDPGQPWKQHPLYQAVLAARGAPADAAPQKDNPDAERAKMRAIYVAGESGYGR